MTEDEKDIQEFEEWWKFQGMPYSLWCDIVAKELTFQSWLAARQSLRKENEKGKEYLTRLLTSVAPQCEPTSDLSGLISQIDNYIVGQRKENKRLEGNLKTSQWFVTEMSKGIKELHTELARLQGEAPDAGYNSLNLDDITDIYKFKGSPETKLEIKKGRV